MRRNLNELALKYFRTKGYRAEENIVLEGVSGIYHKFDLLISKSNEKHVVKILDWKRTVGVNMIINLDKASADIGLNKPIGIAGNWSSHAKSYANRKSITILTRRDLNKF